MGAGAPNPVLFEGQPWLQTPHRGRTAGEACPAQPEAGTGRKKTRRESHRGQEASHPETRDRERRGDASGQKAALTISRKESAAGKPQRRLASGRAGGNAEPWRGRGGAQPDHLLFAEQGGRPPESEPRQPGTQRCAPDATLRRWQEHRGLGTSGPLAGDHSSGSEERAQLSTCPSH